MPNRKTTVPATPTSEVRPSPCAGARLSKLLPLLAATLLGLPALGANPVSAPRRIAAQIVASADNGQQPFLIVDKVGARLYVFAPDGTLRGSSPVLLGVARGDDSVPGIGERKIADILPFERTTPAGRFKAEAGRNLGGEDIVWVDYDAAVSMHRVRATNPRERRLERLASSTVADNRISYGCINVPAAFFDAWVSPIFKSSSAPVYVLPEVRHEREVFSFLKARALAPVSPPDPALSAALPGN